MQGIDVSNWQGNIDWAKVRKNGKEFAAIKATEGIYGKDPYFSHNWNAAKKHGIVRGAYHFYIPTENPIDQADYLHEYVRENGRFHYGDFVMLDLEVTMGVSSFEIVASAAAFVRRCLQQIDKPVFVYTGISYWRDTLGMPQNKTLLNCPLWLAEYGVDKPTSRLNWPVISFWQYTDSGEVNGVSGGCDLDEFFGSKEQLYRVCVL